MKLFSISYKTRNWLFIIGGCIISIYIIYVRLLLTRPSRILFIDITELQLLIYFDLFLIFLILTLIHLYKIYRKSYPRKKELKNKILIKILFHLRFTGFYISQLNKYCLLFFDDFLRNTIIQKCFDQKKLLLNMAETFRKTFSCQVYSYNIGVQYKWATRAFVVFPKILMLFILSLDIFIFARLHYFYLAAPIFLIPLIFEYYLHLMTWTLSPYVLEGYFKVRYINKSTNTILTAEKYLEIKAECMLPYKEWYVIVNKEQFKNISNITISLTPDYLDTLAPMEKAEAIWLTRKESELFRKYSDCAIIVKRLGLNKQLYMDVYKIDFLLTIGYTICWGYVFIRSYLVFIN